MWKEAAQVASFHVRASGSHNSGPDTAAQEASDLRSDDSLTDYRTFDVVLDEISIDGDGRRPRPRPVGSAVTALLYRS